MQVVTDPERYAEARVNKAAREGATLQPIILILGAAEKPTQIFVINNGEFTSKTTLYSAILYAHSLFWLFDLAYPPGNAMCFYQCMEKMMWGFAMPSGDVHIGVKQLCVNFEKAKSLKRGATAPDADADNDVVVVETVLQNVVHQVAQHDGDQSSVGGASLPGDWGDSDDDFILDPESQARAEATLAYMAGQADCSQQLDYGNESVSEHGLSGSDGELALPGSGERALVDSGGESLRGNKSQASVDDDSGMGDSGEETAVKKTMVWGKKPVHAVDSSDNESDEDSDGEDDDDDDNEEELGLPPSPVRRKRVPLPATGMAEETFFAKRGRRGRGGGPRGGGLRGGGPRGGRIRGKRGLK